MTSLTLRPIHETEREAAANLVASVFGDGDAARYNLIYHYYTVLRPQRPGASTSQEWAAFVDGQMVAFMGVEPYALRYGRAVLKVAGIGSVCTHPAHRQQGYAAALMREVLAFAAEEGSHLVLLDGIPNYYDRFGFMPVWPGYRFSVSAEDAAALPLPLPIRPAETDDAAPMAHLYAQQWGGRVAFLRSEEQWRWRLWAYPHNTYVVHEPDGAVVGYMHLRALDDRGRVEAVAGTQQAVQTLLAYGGMRWRDAGYETMSWALPPDDFMIPHAQQMLPVTLSARYAPNGGWMARMLDAGDLLRTLLPEITAQAHSTNPAFSPDSLRLRVESDGVDLGLRGQPATHCRLSLRDFIQVLFGSLTPVMLGLRQGLSPAQVSLLEALFPPRVAALAVWDWF